MPTRKPEPIAEQVWDLLEAGTPWRTIEQRLGVSASVIRRVRKEGRRPSRPSPVPTPMPRRDDGLAAFLPEVDSAEPIDSTPAVDSAAVDGPSALDRAPPVASSAVDRTVDSTPAVDGAVDAVDSTPTVDSAEVDGKPPWPRTGTCPGCGARWTYSLRDAHDTCPACHLLLVYTCSECGERFALEPGEAMPESCPTCGEAS